MVSIEVSTELQRFHWQPCLGADCERPHENHNTRRPAPADPISGFLRFHRVGAASVRIWFAQMVRNHLRAKAACWCHISYSPVLSLKI